MTTLPAAPATITISKLDPENLVPEGFFILDVREDDEWAAGHAPDAVHLPLRMLQDQLAQLPDGTPIVVCRSGARSAIAADMLTLAGRPAINLAGGMGDWQFKKYPLLDSAGQPGRII